MKPKTASTKILSILLAEDDDDDFYLIGKACSEVNSNIILKRVTDGKLLLMELEKLGSRMPSLVILDLRMPGMHGRDALRFIQEKFPAKFNTVVLTTSNHLHEKELCCELGASAFYTKPSAYSGYLEIIYDIVDKQLQFKVESPELTRKNLSELTS